LHMLSNKKNNNSGFTIIEVLIVLAIAGLIMLIVFLAVPALQRNARNTSRKSDASALLAGISEYTDNNNGTLPTALGAITNSQTQFCNQAACAGGDAPASVKVGYYTKIGTGTTGSINLVNGVSNPGVAVDEVLLEIGVTCAGNTPTAAGAGARSVAALYGIETGGATLVWQCVAS
jgi:prepilin-type N-terminal cleavage/methylation domain-containing protein